MDIYTLPVDCRILVCDDNPGGRQTLRQMLRAGGYSQLLEAPTGAECLELAREEHPDLILLDVNLPDVSGFRVAHTLKTYAGTAGIPIIQMSACFTSAESQVAGLEAGADVYLTRPFKPRHLLATVKALLRSRAAEQRLSEAVRARDEFLATAAHDLRSPLAALKIRLEMLQRSLGSAGDSVPTATVQAPLDTVKQQADQLEALLENLLDVSALDAGNSRYSFEHCDLASLVAEQVQRFQPQASAAESPIAIVATAPASGWWDRLSIQQILGNLLSNAIKYGAGRPIEVSLESTDDCACLRVRDHGIGIPPERQPFIFRRYTRALQERQQGSYGLGLWIVQRIVGELGGSIGVDSVLREGSTFSVWLPIRQQPPQPAGAAGGATLADATPTE